MLLRAAFAADTLFCCATRASLRYDMLAWSRMSILPMFTRVIFAFIDVYSRRRWHHTIMIVATRSFARKICRYMFSHERAADAAPVSRAIVTLLITQASHEHKRRCFGALIRSHAVFAGTLLAPLILRLRDCCCAPRHDIDILLEAVIRARSFGGFVMQQQREARECAVTQPRYSCHAATLRCYCLYAAATAAPLMPCCGVARCHMSAGVATFVTLPFTAFICRLFFLKRATKMRVFAAAVDAMFHLPPRRCR